MTSAIKARCACCLDPVGAVWQVMTGHRTFVVCGSGGCEQWAWAQGLSPVRWNARPPVSRRHKTCANCNGELPRRKADRWGEFCTLTCQNRATA